MSFLVLLAAAALQVPAPAPAPRVMPRPAPRPYCPVPYTGVRTLTVQFEQGSAELPEGARAQLIELFTPIAGEPLAEVEVQRYFPYGVRDTTDPAAVLGMARFTVIEETAVSAGVSGDLVGADHRTAPWRIGDSTRAPYPPGRVERMDVTVKVKTACHPLVEVAMRLNPYD
ncbi:hypothetical protein [Brevundimonas sp.]|uniref:hypothetical protein n=1 Tax=Brevundimonas sp. TaxID=1871086 RepID=UPI002EDA444C